MPMDTDLGDDQRDTSNDPHYFVTCLIYCLLIYAVILILALCGRTVNAGGLFCDVVGSETPISEGMDISEYDTQRSTWMGIPDASFEGKPYLILIGPENGYYAIFEAIGGGVIAVPFASLETGDDGWQHDTCGYLITWTP